MSCRCTECGAPVPDKSGIRIDPLAGEISRGGLTAAIRPLATKVVAKLARHAGQVVPRGDLFDHLYGDRPEADWPDTDRVIDTTMCKVRPRLLALGLDVQGVYGAGYRLNILEMNTEQSVQ